LTRVDVLVDGRLRLAKQRADNEEVWRRVRSWVLAHEVTIRPAVTSPTPTPTPRLPALAQNVIFTAWAPAAVPAGLPAKWKVAISADPAFEAAARAGADRARALGHTVAAWGNQEQIGADRIRNFAAGIGADYAIYQAETAAEYDSAVRAGAHVIVGNPNAWTHDQRYDATGRVNRDELALVFETYTNEGGPWPDQASAQGVPAASLCLGVGRGKTPYTLADYRAHTPPAAWPTISVYLAEHVPDWEHLP
jgi:hypothetical protein